MTNLFPKDSQSGWKSRAEKELKGRPLSSLNWRSSTGQVLSPYYNHENQSRIYPVRQAPTESGWDIFDEIVVDDPKTANTDALEALNGGATALRFVWKHPSNADLAVLLKGIQLPFIQSAFIIPGNLYPEFCLMLAEYVRKEGFNQRDIGGFIKVDCSDPVDGKNFANLVGEFVENVPAVAAALSGYRLLVMDMATLGQAGLHSHEELGLALAWFKEWIELLESRGIAYDKISHLWQLNLSIGREYYTEMSKFRVVGHLLSLVAEKYGTYRPVYVYGMAREWYLSPLDRHNNILRLCTAGMSAVLGGCNGLMLPGFSRHGSDDPAFVKRITRNIQLIMQHEAGLGQVKDPAAGSWFLEEMSFALAEQSWDYFLEVEKQGGFSSYLKKGFLDQQLIRNRESLREAVASRGQFFLGVNQFPAIEEYPPVSPDPETGPVHSLQLAEAFYALKSGKPRKAILLKYGDLAKRNARAAFADNFLRCGNWITEELEWNGGEIPNSECIVLCSSDEEYPDLLNKLTLSKKVFMVMAGNPGENETAYRTLGVNNFIHLGTPLYATLKKWKEESHA